MGLKWLTRLFSSAKSEPSWSLGVFRVRGTAGLGDFGEWIRQRAASRGFGIGHGKAVDTTLPWSNSASSTAQRSGSDVGSQTLLLSLK